jgi:hypothetical protein
VAAVEAAGGWQRCKSGAKLARPEKPDTIRRNPACGTSRKVLAAIRG